MDKLIIKSDGTPFGTTVKSALGVEIQCLKSVKFYIGIDNEGTAEIETVSASLEAKAISDLLPMISSIYDDRSSEGRLRIREALDWIDENSPPRT